MIGFGIPNFPSKNKFGISYKKSGKWEMGKARSSKKFECELSLVLDF